MKVKALTNFAGIETMHCDEVKNINDEVASDLINCGYVEAVEEPVSQPPAGGAEDGATGEDDHAAGGTDDGATGEDDNAAGSADDGAATPPVKGSRKSAAKSNKK